MIYHMNRRGVRRTIGYVCAGNCGICRFTCSIPPFLLTALHISFLLSASAAVLVWSLDQPSRSWTERKTPPDFPGYTTNVVRAHMFGLEHQQYASPTCGTVLSYFYFVKKKKNREKKKTETFVPARQASLGKRSAR